jgi:hypothetical protein
MVLVGRVTHFLCGHADVAAAVVATSLHSDPSM